MGDAMISSRTSGRRIQRRILGLLAAGSVVATAGQAAAMAPPPCAPAVVAPRAQHVPANLPGFGYTALSAEAKDVHLYNVTGGKTEVPLTLGPASDGYLKLVPSTPLVPGSSYELEYAPFCWRSAYTSEPLKFVVTPEAPIPTKLGTIEEAPTFALKEYGTTQVTFTEAFLIDAEMKPWLAVYSLALHFDGKPITTKIVPAAGGDALSVSGTAWCDEASAATTTHTLALRAKLPFAPTLESPVATLQFQCTAPKITGAPAHPIPTPTANPRPSGGGSEPTTVTTTQGGCSASPASTSSLAGLGVGLFVALIGLARRRSSGAAAASARR